jgi:hypothetical protein
MYMKMRKIITCGEITKRKSIVQHPRGKKQPLSQGGKSMACTGVAAAASGYDKRPTS